MHFVSFTQVFSDGARNHPNQLILAFVILSMAYVIEHQYLMSAFCYRVALNSKQIAVYYSLAYFLIVYGLTPSFNSKNLLKLGSLVIMFHFLLYLSFVSSIDKMLYSMSGGFDKSFFLVPNIPNLYTLLELVMESKYTRTYRIPQIGRVLVMGAFIVVLGKLICQRRDSKHFPLFAFISGLAFYNSLDLVHPKHHAYLSAPLVIYGVVVGGAYLKAAAGLKALSTLYILSEASFFERLSIRHPLLIFSLWQFKLFNPEYFRYF